MTLDPTHPEETDRLIRALSEHRRRSILRFLQQHREASISEIATEISAKRDDGQISDGGTDSVRTDLYHRHVPILAEAGLVRYTEERDVVAISERGTTITEFLGECLF